MGDIKIVEFSPDWEQKHEDFAKMYWPNKRRRYIPEYIYWKFRGIEGNKLPSFALAIDNNKVIGQFGFIPCDINVNGNVHPAQWICDLLVSINYRGKGVAKLLYNFIEKNGRLSLGSNPSPACQKSLLRSGYTLISGPNKWIYPISIGGTLMLKSKRFRYFRWVKNPVLFYLNKKYKENLDIFVSVDKSEIIKKYHLPRKEYNIPYVVHDDLFLNWRCDKFKHYYPGMKIIESLHNNSYVCFMRASDAVFITDYHYENISDLATILLMVGKYGEREKLSYIKVLSNSDKDDLAFRRLLLIKMRTPTKIIIKNSSFSANKINLGNKFFYTLMDSDSNI